PAPTPSASSSSTLASSSELVAGWRSLVDDTGNWVKVGNKASAYGENLTHSSSSSRRIWTLIPKKFWKDYRISGKTAIKPASHLITPPVVLASATKKQKTKSRSIFSLSCLSSMAEASLNTE
uniref:WWE domain-containing protein n=1 Tax=Mesocestoides corti TaxID=53468 RepID=A0A5K3EKD6_MESCO